MLSSSLLLCLSWLSASLAFPVPSDPPKTPDAQCSTLIKHSGDGSKYESYLCGSDLLGPKKLPVEEPLRTILGGYSRFGNLSPEAFLAKYRTRNPRPGRSGDVWNYPGFNGFKMGVDGNPMKMRTELVAGTYLDRFGNDNGSYLSLACTPYTQRAIPPDSLAEEEWSLPGYPFNYHVYQVNHNMTVWAGPSAPGFEQLGLGLQFWTKGTTVRQLVENGTLAEVSANDLLKLGGCGERRVAEQINLEVGEL